ncbi:MAG: hypothetical protein R3E95_05375 [Thiolinea sp.]
MLGVGKDAVADEGGNSGAVTVDGSVGDIARGAWYPGRQAVAD